MRRVERHRRRTGLPPSLVDTRPVRRSFVALMAGAAILAPSIGLGEAVYGDPIQRRAALEELGRGLARSYCRPRPVCAYDPVAVVDGGEGISGRTAARQGLSLWSGVSYYYADGDTRRLENALGILRSWASADALRGVAGNRTRARHYLKRALFPAITAYGVMRAVLDIPSADRQAIERWLERGVALMDRDNVDGASHSDTNNSRYSRDAVNMAWGVVIGDEARFRAGVERYRQALRQMRADGSFPQETARGPRALTYQNLAVSILISMAEMASRRGLNLYAESFEGRTIHQAVGFLLAAERDDAALKVYADAPQKKLRLGNHLHWTEIYLARFPGHENADGLGSLRKRYYFRTGGANDFVGGNLSCVFAGPETHEVLVDGPPKEILAILRKDAPPPIPCPRYLD